MGCYDTINVPCPKCGEIYDAQSKSGDCLLDVYELDTAPQDVLLDINRHAPFICYNCGTKFMVRYDSKVEISNIRVIII